MSNDPRISQALENWDTYVAQLATMPDKKLVEKLEVINMQAVIAQGKNIISSSELLEIWWQQVVEARTYKAENNVPDAPNEIELAIADIEIYQSQSEPSMEIVEEMDQPVLSRRSKRHVPPDNNSQLSMF